MNKTKAGGSEAWYAQRGHNPTIQDEEEEEGNKQEGQCNTV